MKTMRYFMLFSCLLCIQLALGQPKESEKIANEYFAKAESFIDSVQYEKAIENFEKASQYFKYSSLWEDYIVCYQAISWIFTQQQQPKKVIAVLQKILPKAVQKLGHEHNYVADICNNLTTAYHEEGDFYQAFVYGKKALTIYENLADVDVINLGIMYNNLGNISEKRGDLTQGIYYYQKTLSVYEKSDSIDKFELVTLYHNFAQNFRYQKKGFVSIQYFEKALKTLSEINSKTAQISQQKQKWKIHLYNGIALSCYINEEYDKGFYWLYKSLVLARKNKKELSVIYQNIGDLYYGKKEYQNSLDTLQLALELWKEKHTIKHRNLSKCHREIGKAYEGLKKYNSALSSYQEALINFAPAFNDTNIYTNPPLSMLDNQITILTTIILKANAFLGKYKHQTKNLKDAQFALQTYLLADSLAQKLRQSYEAEGSKYNLAEEILTLYEKAIEVALLLYQETKEAIYQDYAFSFAEKNKATVLLDMIREVDAKQLSLPDSLLKKEQALKLAIVKMEKEIYDKQKENESSLQNLAGKLASLKIDYTHFIKQLEKNYPNYHQLKHNSQTATLQDIQNTLDKKTAFIEYFLGDSTFYTFTITNGNVKIQQQFKPKSFDSIFTAFRKSLTDYQIVGETPKKRNATYIQQSLQLYEWLLKKPLEKIPQEIEKLVIVPDGKLGYLSFEALLHQRPKNGKLTELKDYLIDKYQISYAYSATLKVNLPKSQNLNTTYAGFAPKYNENLVNRLDSVDRAKVENGTLIAFATRRDIYKDLPSARACVQYVARLFNGTSYLNQQATEVNFKEKASDYGILHLAMHGILDDRNPLYSKFIFAEDFLQKEDGFLTAAEIYTMKIKAGLAVLSACNTGMGTIRRGEGIMSLGRAFAYAGCPSLVMSLWSVPDKATGEIMQFFYQSLQKGQTKDEALRNAKLAYWKVNGESPEKLHPIFWAGFVPIGEMEAIGTMTSQSYLFFMLLTLFLIGLIIIFFLVKKKENYQRNVAII